MSPRYERLLLALVLLGAWVLRVSPFFRSTGVLGWCVDYDEGVYLSAAHALTQGQVPWRDFAFLHPPGILYFFAPFSFFDPRLAWSLARWVMALVGVGNVALVYLLVRTKGPFAAGLLGAVLYATWPEAVVAERGAFIEPVLNFACLSLMLGVAKAWAPARLGALMALALSLKSWAVFWVCGALVGCGKARARQLGWAALLLTVVVGSLALLAPAEAWHQLFATHLRRPPDGDLELWVRLREMFIARSPLPVLILLVSLPSLWRAREAPVVRALVTAFVLVVAAFLKAPAFWNQYDAHLAAVLAPLAALGFAGWQARFDARVATGLALLVAIPGTVNLVQRRHEGGSSARPDVVALARLAPSARVCALEATEVLLRGRWPSPPFDSYGQQLADAARSGRSESAGAAMGDPHAQQRLVSQLCSCDVFVPTTRDASQLTTASQELLRACRPLAPPEVH